MKNHGGVAIVSNYGPEYGDREFGVRPLHMRDVAKSIEGTSLKQFNHLFPDSDACLQHVFDVKFGQGFPCPVCNSPAFWKRRRTRRSFTTSCCNNAQIFPLSGTVFHRTKIPLWNWFFLLLNFTNSKTGFSSTHARRLLGISQEIAFHMCDRIRTHLALLECTRFIGGPGQYVYIDEALVRGITSDGELDNRIIVLGICTDTELNSVIVPDRKAGTLIPIIERMVAPGSILVTDSFASYRSLASRGWRREVVNHSKNIYVNENGISQAQIETYWKYLKKSLRGTHLKVSRRNVWKYISAFNFVYNRRKTSNEIFWDSVSLFPNFLASELPRYDVDPGYGSKLLPDLGTKTGQ